MNRIAFTVTLVLSAIASPSFAQDARPQCPDAELHRYDFLVGDWTGREYTFAHGPGDSTFEAKWTAHNRKLPYQCAFEERWQIFENGKLFNQAAIMRAYDL